MFKLRGQAVFVLLSSFALSACTTINPYTKETQTSKATIGAGVGALAGAVIGLISGDDGRERRKRALIGAGLGALAGGSVGYYMDVQEAKLRQKLAGSGVSVTRQGDNIVLNMPSNITFGVDSANISSDFYEYFASRDIKRLRIATYGHGEDYPVASNNTEQGRSQNRRVEIVLVPITA